MPLAVLEEERQPAFHDPPGDRLSAFLHGREELVGGSVCYVHNKVYRIQTFFFRSSPALASFL